MVDLSALQGMFDDNPEQDTVVNLGGFPVKKASSNDLAKIQSFAGKAVEMMNNEVVPSIEKGREPPPPPKATIKCPACGWEGEVKELVENRRKCPKCGELLIPATEPSVPMVGDLFSPVGSSETFVVTQVGKDPATGKVLIEADPVANVREVSIARAKEIMEKPELLKERQKIMKQLGGGDDVFNMHMTTLIMAGLIDPEEFLGEDPNAPKGVL